MASIVGSPSSEESEIFQYGMEAGPSGLHSKFSVGGPDLWTGFTSFLNGHQELPC